MSLKTLLINRLPDEEGYEPDLILLVIDDFASKKHWI
ncbi:hypothetical protein EPIR_1314 [Erwinia piriflorinigrans CFBP 5888]|uniref:Uncharacterized protein n=1 Tax=Erwinia piriflorinigrans CFBP 5888 TaxID=1161919 RepID=V5Z6S1_9GAMM|nr:hypothetical protein EPIR_1314 [Erwinia piriflorinigrans CFBP 5888]